MYILLFNLFFSSVLTVCGLQQLLRFNKTVRERNNHIVFLKTTQTK